MCFIVVSLVEISLFYLVWGIKFVCMKGMKLRILLLCLVMTTLLIYYFGFIHGSCKDWEKGLGGLQIEQVEGECVIVPPTYCELSIREGWYDINRFTKECKNHKMTVLKNFLPEKLKHRNDIKTLGLPRNEYYSNAERIYEDVLVKTVRDGLIDMDDPTVPDDVKKNIEFTIDMTDKDSHILNVNLKRNNTRANELKAVRKQVLEQDKLSGNTERIDKDVFVFYIDNISRAHFHRKLKKFTAWLSQFVNNDDVELEATEYFRYHPKYFNTYPNTNALFYGTNGPLLTESKNVFRTFSENGYITGEFRDECEMINTEYSKNVTYTEPFFHFDHFAISVPCDANFDQANSMNLAFSTGRNSHYRR